MTIDAELERLAFSVVEIEGAVARRLTVTEDELAAISVFWDDVVYGVIPSLLDDADSGRLTSSQIGRLDASLARIRTVIPTFEDFDFVVPNRMERETRQLTAA